jgi:hypothetical protein
MLELVSLEKAETRSKQVVERTADGDTLDQAEVRDSICFVLVCRRDAVAARRLASWGEEVLWEEPCIDCKSDSVSPQVL